LAANCEGLRMTATRSIAAGVGYLASVQMANGEFPVDAAYSLDMTQGRFRDPCFFGTAAIASTLAGCEEAAAVSARACDFIERECKAGRVWGYHKKGHRYVYPPPDVDDTALASLALVANGRAAPRNRAILLANRNDQGLFYTWILPWRLGRFRLRLLRANWWQFARRSRHRAYFRDSLCEIDDIDAGVNANVLAWLGSYSGDRQVTDWFLQILREHREASCDKYYDDPVVIRYFFSRVLAGCCDEAGQLLVERAVVTADASALQIALTILIRSLWRAPVPGELVQRLIAAQDLQGNWPIASLYCAGRRRLAPGHFAPTDPDRFRSGSEAMTTAFCISALNAVREAA